MDLKRTGIKGLVTLAASGTLALTTTLSAQAQSCGNNASGYNTWKAQFADTAARSGVGQRGLQALAASSYSSKTISVDRAAQRGGKAFSGNLNSFLQRRGGDAIVRVGKQKKREMANIFADIERRYGVPAGPILAIWGMETGFGRFMGSENVVSSIATVTYDCRRSDFFKPHLIAALKLVDRGTLSGSSKGAAHGEYGHTQFLPNNIVKFGVDGNGDGRVDLKNVNDALYSTANFLRAYGMSANYQQGQRGYGAIRAWNAAPVYQQAIAYLGQQIDG